LDKDHLKNVLLVFPSSLQVNRKTKIKSVVRKKLQLSNIKVNKIIFEEACIAFEVTDVVEAAALIVRMFGISKVAVAKCVSNRFTDVVTTVVKTGKQIMLPGEKFFIRVEKSSKAKISYIGKDIEFASSGNLIAELSPIAAKPAKNEYEASKIILSYIGKRSAYVCVQTDTALGGMLPGSQKDKVMCAIHNLLSCLSCMMAIKCGFIPDFLIMYTNEVDLKENSKLFGRIISKMSIRKYDVRLVHIDLPDKCNDNLKLMLQEGVYARILTLLPGKRGVVMSLNAAIHPLWFVESTMRKIASTGKMLWMPLMLLTDGMYHDAKNVGLEDKIMSIDDLVTKKMMFKRHEYERYERTIDTLSKAAVKNMKTISLKVGPNYLHDIIDSI
jgi:hypothetical protein